MDKLPQNHVKWYHVTIVHNAKCDALVGGLGVITTMTHIVEFIIRFGVPFELWGRFGYILKGFGRVEFYTLESVRGNVYLVINGKGHERI